MLSRVLERLARYADRNPHIPDWTRAIEVFLRGVDNQLDAGRPLLEIGVENRPILKLNILPNRLFTTQHLESLPWLSAKQRSLARVIARKRSKFQYGIKLADASIEFEIYAHEEPDGYFAREIFPVARAEHLHPLSFLRAFALNSEDQLSSYWLDPERRGIKFLPAIIANTPASSELKAEPWVHYRLDGENWGAAKIGLQLYPVTTRIDQALRLAMPSLVFADLFGPPSAHHSANIAFGSTRACLYMTLNGHDHDPVI